MMKERLKDDLMVSMKAKDKDRSTLIRMIQAEIKNAEILNRRDLTEDETLAVVNKVKVQTKESLDMYEAAGTNPEATEKNRRWLDLVMGYLPSQLTAEEVRAIVQTIVDQNGLKGKQDMGKLMSLLMPQIKGKFDGREANKIVSEVLG